MVRYEKVLLVDVSFSSEGFVALLSTHPEAGECTEKSECHLQLSVGLMPPDAVRHM